MPKYIDMYETNSLYNNKGVCARLEYVLFSFLCMCDYLFLSVCVRRYMCECLHVVIVETIVKHLLKCFLVSEPFYYFSHENNIKCFALNLTLIPCISVINIPESEEQ